MIYNADGLFVLSTGRVLGPTNGPLLNPDEYRRGCLLEGYDGQVHGIRPDSDEPPLTDAERHEIAEYMIERWRTWAETGYP